MWFECAIYLECGVRRRRTPHSKPRPVTSYDDLHSLIFLLEPRTRPRIRIQNPYVSHTCSPTSKALRSNLNNTPLVQRATASHHQTHKSKIHTHASYNLDLQLQRWESSRFALPIQWQQCSFPHRSGVLNCRKRRLVGLPALETSCCSEHGG